jgi:GPH family glycoside/pentoside/hexuronide:cation symporter
MFDMGLSLVVSCWMSLLPEIAPDVNKRVKISYVVGIITLIAGFFVIIFAGVKDFGIPAFQMMSIVVGIMCFILFFLVGTFSHEREEYKDDEPLGFFDGLKETVKSKSFMIFIGYNFFAVVNNSLTIAYLFIYQLITPLNLIGFYIIMIFNSTVANAIGMKLQPKWGFRKIILRFGIFKIILGILFYVISLLITEGGLGLTVPLIGYLIVSFLGGIIGGFGHTLMTLSMDEDELKTGVRRENTFLGVNALFTKPGDSVGPVIATLILGMTNYVRNAPAIAQPASAIAGIKTIFFLVPAIFTIISLIFMYFYPIHGEYKEKMYTAVEELHQEKIDRLAEKTTK